MYDDIEVGYDEDGFATYVQISLYAHDYSEIPRKWGLESWPLKGGMELNELLDVFKKMERVYTVRDSKIIPDFDEVVTASGLVFVVAKSGAEFVGVGLVKVRAGS